MSACPVESPCARPSPLDLFSDSLFESKIIKNNSGRLLMPFSALLPLSCPVHYLLHARPPLLLHTCITMQLRAALPCARPSPTLAPVWLGRALCCLLASAVEWSMPARLPLYSASLPCIPVVTNQTCAHLGAYGPHTDSDEGRREACNHDTFDGNAEGTVAGL